VTPEPGQGGEAPPLGRSGQALGFAMATIGYLPVTTAESLLAPVVPVVRDELGIDLGTVGLALALLSLAIATGNLAGGVLLAHRGARHGLVGGLAITTAGALAAAAGHGRIEFLLAQMLIGLGSGVATASQYGTVAFLPTFAVLIWGLSPASAALALTEARLLSVPAKLVSGNATDQAGSLRIARRLGIVLCALGIWWTVVPHPQWALWAAVVFAALVSGLGPVANVLAFDSFGGEGMLLGAFRSAQIGVGAAASAAVGGASSLLGLRPTLMVAVLVPLLLVPVGMRVKRSTSA
jgi:Major Facilitator Superfamily